MDWSDFWTICAQGVIGAFVVFVIICIGSAAVGALKKDRSA